MKKIDPVSKYFLTLFSMFRSNIRDYGMYIALTVIFLVFTILTGGIFLGPINFTNLLNQTAYVAVLAVGMILVIVTRQIDLSVGYLGAFLGAFVVVHVETSTLEVKEWIIVTVVLISALILTVIIGIIKGMMVAKIKVPAFVVTLAGMFIFKGMLYYQTNNRTIPTSFNFFNELGVGYLHFDIFVWGGKDYLPLIVGFAAIVLIVLLSYAKRQKNIKLGISNEQTAIFITKIVFLSAIIYFFANTLASYKGISYLFLVTIFVVFIYHILSTQTVLGRRIYAVGGNPEAARLSGINVENTLVIVFVSMGIMALFAGVMYASMLQNTSPNHGPFWELYAIAASFIGGASADGGVGKVVNAVIGAIVMMSLKNGMALAGVNANLEPIILGSVLALAVVFDIYTRNVRPIDLVGIHYARQQYHKDYDEAKMLYLKAKANLAKARKDLEPNLVNYEFAYTNAQTAYTRIRDKIRASKETDFNLI